MTEARQLTPLTILTGYLGAGKTTLLNRILNAEHGLNVAVLVNDFGSVNIDAKLIVNIEGEKVTLSNGCICCTIRGDLVNALGSLIQSNNPPEYIIIETSGVSDPAQVVLTINRSNLRSKVEIDSIVAVVDAEQFRDVKGKPERLLVDQIRVSDLVILNKIDLVDALTLKNANEWVTSQINKARILESVECNVPIEAVLGIGTYNPQTAFGTTGHGVHVHGLDELVDHEHHDHSLVFATWDWESHEPLVITEVRRILDELSKDIFRAKGILYLREMPDKKVVLQMVGKRVSLTEGEPWGDETRRSQIVVIGELGAFDKANLKDSFERSRARHVPETEFSQLVNGVLKWLRLKS